MCFNPHPALRPGVTMKRPLLAIRATLFQSPPGLTAGCDSTVIDSLGSPMSFQSPPGLTAGCDCGSAAPASGSRSFQSPPGLTAGCDEHGACIHSLIEQF